MKSHITLAKSRIYITDVIREHLGATKGTKIAQLLAVDDETGTDDELDIVNNGAEPYTKAKRSVGTELIVLRAARGDEPGNKLSYDNDFRSWYCEGTLLISKLTESVEIQSDAHGFEGDCKDTVSDGKYFVVRLPKRNDVAPIYKKRDEPFPPPPERKIRKPNVERPGVFPSDDRYFEP